MTQDQEPRTGGLRAGFEYYRALWEDVEHNKENAHTKLTMPVLALGGERGFGQRVVRSMQVLAENVRGGVIERCGHWIAEERPDELLAQLLAFFGKSRVHYYTTGAHDVDGV